MFVTAVDFGGASGGGSSCVCFVVVLSVASPFFNILQKDNMDDVFLVTHLASQNPTEEKTHKASTYEGDHQLKAYLSLERSKSNRK